MRIALLFLILAINSVPAQEVQREYIILSGGLRFKNGRSSKRLRTIDGGEISSALAQVRIEQLRKQHGPSALITWLVYKPGYVRRAVRQDHADLIGHIVSVRDKYGVNLIFFTILSRSSTINSGRPRDRVKIAVSSSTVTRTKLCFMFDYSNEIDSGSKVWLHESELRRIRRGILATRLL